MEKSQYLQVVEDVEFEFTHEPEGHFSLSFKGGTVPSAKLFLQGLQAALADVEGQQGDNKRKEQLTRDRTERLERLRNEKEQLQASDPTADYSPALQEELSHLTELEKNNEL